MRDALLALAVLALGAGCSEPDVLTFVLVHDPLLDPASNFTSARVRIFDLGDIAVAGDETRVVAETAPTADALAGVSSEALRMLVPGNDYIAVLSFETTACRTATQVVGRSLVFEHREGGYEVPVQVGCAEELSPTRRPPRRGRAFGTTTATTEGAIVAGGLTGLSSTGAPGPGAATVERYDLSTGSFEEVGAVASTRTNAASVLLASGEVALLGGVGDDGTTCQTTTEVVYPAPRPGVDLDVPRCGPAATQLDLGQVLVAGGDGGFIARNVILDAALNSVVEILEPGSSVHRQQPQLLPIGPAAIVLDGGGDGASAVEVVAPGCSTTGAPCYYPVAIDPADDPGPTWTGARGALVACIEGSTVTTGALYLFGGQVVASPGDPPTPVDGAFCTEVSADIAEWRIRRVTMPVPFARISHQVVAVEHHAGPRLLVVGGSQPGTDLAYSDAITVDVRACMCEILAAEVRPALVSGALIGHTATPLSDGTVLVAGALGADTTTGGVVSLPYSALYFPDTERD